MDHDQRFKALIQEFLQEFMFLFLEEHSQIYDFSDVEWLNQKLFLPTKTPSISTSSRKSGRPLPCYTP